MDAVAQSPVSLLRRKEVERRVGLSRSTIYGYIAKGTFPAPVALGARSVGWIASEVDGWIASRIAASRRAAA